MKKINWSNKLSVGNIQIDNEHKILIDIYNDLVDLVHFKKNNDEFSRILSKLTEYCLVHFKGEEEYMYKLAYPLLDDHKRAHNKFIHKVSMFNIGFSKHTPPVPEEIVLFLDEWLVKHISVADKEYEDYKNKVKSDLACLNSNFFKEL